MKSDARKSEKQKGAALLIVLLLAATLSFIALSLVTAMTYSAQRTSGVALRGELLWRAVSAEAIAAGVIDDAMASLNQGGPPLSPAHPLFSRQLAVPMPEGAGAIIFADATRCFNLNSLAGGAQPTGARQASDEETYTPRDELIEILKHDGVSESQAADFVSVVSDWIDTDSIQNIGGAEDGFYTSLPTPFRTGAALLAHKSEIRAMSGVSEDLYAGIISRLCAYPTRDGVVINVNMLDPSDAPLLAALIGPETDPRAIADALADRPPGGWGAIDQFLALPVFASDDIDTETLEARTAITSRYIEALAGAEINEIDMTVRLLFMTGAESGGAPTLIRRELGASQ